MKEKQFIKRLKKSGISKRDKRFNFNRRQRELFLSEVTNGETITATEANNDMYCLQK